ncbi:uncharacterized protein LOC114336127 [Diabrotica virgifera virgifera]|uniref:EB domain-containing protein n=2 Tax=Diabrotica virgifera virgifera TaxID=50390 RepID=A0ABM5IUB8_DIAVI|nr:uncharacterized protein LOC114336127 [Diabrotica virgifera virgifera]
MKISKAVPFFVFLFTTAVYGEQKCNYSDLTEDDGCGPNEWCVKTNKCECIPQYKRKDNTCILETSDDPKSSNYSNLVDNQGSGAIVAGILIPLFLIVFVMCGVYLTRKYHLVSWLRSRLHRRNETYDEFMIGQDDDDEPLS